MASKPRQNLRLGEIRPPHGVKSQSKYSDLTQAFADGAAVNPIVVLTFRGHRPQAISGSHRLMALKTVYGAATPVSALSQYVLLHDGDRLLRQLRDAEDQRTLGQVRSMLNRGATYFPDLVDRLAPYLRGQCGSCALSDQGTTGKHRRGRGSSTGTSTTVGHKHKKRIRQRRKSRFVPKRKRKSRSKKGGRRIRTTSYRIVRRYGMKHRNKKGRRGSIGGNVGRSVIFLDIGGTLNHGSGFAEKGRHIDGAAVRRVDDICRKTGAAVVISSSWRRWMSLNRIRSLLRRHGLTARVVGKTPSLYGGRALEVAAWLRKHPRVTSYAVLDDNDAGFDGHFVGIDPSKGLRDVNVKEAVHVLQR